MTISGVVIQGLDAIDILVNLQKKRKKFQAIFLADLEEIEDDPEKFAKIRKLYLDDSNNYTRSVLRMIFGNIEF